MRYCQDLRQLQHQPVVSSMALWVQCQVAKMFVDCARNECPRIVPDTSASQFQSQEASDQVPRSTMRTRRGRSRGLTSSCLQGSLIFDDVIEKESFLMGSQEWSQSANLWFVVGQLVSQDTRHSRLASFSLPAAPSGSSFRCQEVFQVSSTTFSFSRISRSLSCFSIIFKLRNLI